jgi:hypothetical protein
MTNVLQLETSPKLLVSAMDIATTTGVAHGYTNAMPVSFHWDLRDAGKGRPQRLALLRDLCDGYFTTTPVDLFFYEAGMRTAVSVSIGQTDETVAFLRGAIGVVEACAAKTGIRHIQAIDVRDARKQLTGIRTFPKGEAKDVVFRRCKMLGWNPQTLDESDALAIWHFGCGLANQIRRGL